MTGPRDNPRVHDFAIGGTTISISNEKIPADLIPLVTLCFVKLLILLMIMPLLKRIGSGYLHVQQGGNHDQKEHLSKFRISDFCCL